MEFIVWSDEAKIESPTGEKINSTIILEWITAKNLEDAENIFNDECLKKYEQKGFNSFNFEQIVD